VQLAMSQNCSGLVTLGEVDVKMSLVQLVLCLLILVWLPPLVLPHTPSMVGNHQVLVQPVVEAWTTMRRVLSVQPVVWVVAQVTMLETLALS